MMMMGIGNEMEWNRIEMNGMNNGMVIFVGYVCFLWFGGF